MNIMFLLGFAVGILLVAAAFLLVRKMTKSEETCKYDERQELLRGKGYKYGFFCLMIYDFLAGALYIDGYPKWCDELVLNIFGISIALLVFVSYCIWKDAYLALSEKPRQVCAFLLIAIIVNGAVGIGNFVSGEATTGGSLNFRAVNFILAVVLLIVMIELLVKIWLSKKEME